MRSLKFVLVGLTVASALIAAGVAGAAGRDAATGGGQVLVGSKGAGDTIAFTAKGTSLAGEGQVQYVDREGGTGQGQTTHHGTVSCLDVAGNVAKIAGTWRDGGPFQLYVEDNGEGAAADDDVVTVFPNAEEVTCDPDDFEEPEEEDKTALARGNSQVRDR